MSPRIGGALSRMAARVSGSRFAKPIARVALVAAGLVLLAIIGRASAAGAFGGSGAIAASVLDAGADPSPVTGGLGLGGAGGTGIPAPASRAGPLALAAPAFAAAAADPSSAMPTPATGPSSASRGRASADDPVFLNTAMVDDLRRLPGIGQKRADAILALRARLGRFRAVEDLMKVKGIGRAMLKRLRPLVRLDAPLVPLAPLLVDAGAGLRATSR